MSATKKKKPYDYHDEWEHNYFFTKIKEKCCCLKCNSAVAIAKKGNVERHFRTMHSKYETEYPRNSDMRKAKIKDLKVGLSLQQNMFVKALNKPLGTTVASLRVSHLLTKKN